MEAVSVTRTPVCMSLCPQAYFRNYKLKRDMQFATDYNNGITCNKRAINAGRVDNFVYTTGRVGSPTQRVESRKE